MLVSASAVAIDLDCAVNLLDGQTMSTTLIDNQTAASDNIAAGVSDEFPWGCEVWAV